MNNGIHVIGAGGHSKVVISTLLEMGFQVECVWDDDNEKWGSSILSIPVQGPVEKLRDLLPCQAIIAVGDNTTRKKITQNFAEAEWITAVHPRAYVHPSAEIGEGSVIFSGAVVQPEAHIGAHVILNTGATVDHDCQIDNFVHICPGSNLAGAVKLGEGVMVGTGSAIVPGISIGPWSILGAGTVVIHDLPKSAKAVGAPARLISNTASK